ncbi:MAG: hypothetical protein VX777_01970 [Chlamydiota bacterium]|nr:hypothetical protein [Chlamydiota bacterium]
MRCIFKLCFVVLLALNFLSDDVFAQEPYKIVCLISGPRSLSTVFLRIIETRGDFIIYNEPTIPVYDKVHFKEYTKDWFREDSHETFEDVKRNLFESQKLSNVFVKEMSFSSHDYYVNDLSFMKNSSIHFVFLLRNPHHTTLSFYNKVEEVSPMMSDLIGVKKLYHMYEMALKHNPNPVQIIQSEDLYNSPQETINKFCKELGIPYKEKALKWKKYGENFQGHKEWNEQKSGSIIHHWHGRAIESQKIGKPTVYDVDRLGNPTFSEVVSPEHRRELKRVYRENLDYYRRFPR